MQEHNGWWKGDQNNLTSDPAKVAQIIQDLKNPFSVVLKDGQLMATNEGTVDLDLSNRKAEHLPLMASVMPIMPEYLGDPSFCKDHGLKYAYIGGSMAHGISSPKLAQVLGKNGMLGFIGSAGESPEQVEKAILQMKELEEKVPFGVNLINSPNEKALEDAIVDLLIKHQIRLIEASAYLTVTLPLVRYRVHQIHKNENGEIVTPNKIIAKVSRIEVATKFFSPPPAKMLQKLVDSNHITSQQAELASQIPLAQDITSEADSGGHTDNRPAVSLHPTMIALKNRLQKEFNYKESLRVGFGGGTGTPSSAAAAFAMGAAYIVTGTINQACIESGTSDIARGMLAQATQADTAMAPAGDMFEMGVTVQVLKRGTMFAMRAKKLYETYRNCASIDDISLKDRQMLENTIFRDSLENIWNQTKAFFETRDPAQIEKANNDPKHKMALIFRWYLGKSPRWAVEGTQDRKVDYQIWCGPAMGAFNEWTKGSFLEQPENRKAVDIAMNIIYGAALELRLTQLRTQGICINTVMNHPLKLAQIKERL